MAEIDILNPVKGFWPALGDIPTWNYDYTRKKAINKADVSARLGSPYSRDIGNAGHAFAWNWVNRPLATMQRLQKFYDDFKHGYFTIIDWDNGGRHYVGRFISPPNAQLTGHLTWTAQAVQFQEQPLARMLVYPSDFVNDAHPIYVVDDYLRPRIATMQGTWTSQASPLLTGGTVATIDGVVYGATAAESPACFELLNTYANAGDWAQVQYVGWGFTMTLRCDPSFGVCSLALDGVTLVNGLNLATGALVSSSGGVSVTQLAAGTQIAGPFPGGDITYPAGAIVVTITNVPLDMHRVKITAAGGGGSIIFPSLEYIY